MCRNIVIIQETNIKLKKINVMIYLILSLAYTEIKVVNLTFVEFQIFGPKQ